MLMAAMSMNRVTLIGNLGADPEIKPMRGGGSMAQLSVATTERWKDKSTGELQEKTEWHRVVIFSDQLVKVAQDMLRKGSRVYVEGRLQTRKWQDQSGADKYSTEVVLTQFQSMLVTFGDGGERASAPRSPPASAPSAPTPSRPPLQDDLNDEIPF